MNRSTMRRVAAIASGAAAATLAGCAVFNFVSPPPNATGPAPVAAQINWTADLQANTLKVVVDPPNGTDVTSQFTLSGLASGSHADASLNIPPGSHTLSVSGNLWTWYSQSYQPTSTSEPITVVGGPEAVQCSVFDDGNTNEEGPSSEIFFNSGGQACISIGGVPHCHKWFGDCSTAGGKRVDFMVFDDGYSNMRGPTGAVYIPSTSGDQACEPDATSTGTCRKWFGLPYTSDGRNVQCKVFDANQANPSPLTDAIYVLHGSSMTPCAPSDPAVSPNGICRQSFGLCQTTTGSGRPITYQLTVTGTPGPACASESVTSNTFGNGCPVGSLGAVTFGTGNDAAHPVVNLIFTFEGNTENVVPFFAERPCVPNCPRDGIFAAPGYLNAIGTASVTVQEAATGRVLAQGTFLPSAGVFVSVDQGNAGIGFGSLGVIPPDPTFPSNGVEVAYPYALSHASTDLKSNFSSGSIIATSCAGFNGSPGAIQPGTTCHVPLQLPTTAGVLVLEPDEFYSAASFTATLH